MKNISILDVDVYLPENIILNDRIESLINSEKENLAPGSLEKLFGIKERRFANKEMQVSDLASNACRKILQRIECEVDLLIFAAASSDLIEPATANIIQHKLCLSCPVMDIKNACNSVTTAMMVAEAFIRSDKYKNILIANGEKLSDVINFKPQSQEHLIRCLAGYTLGDAGTAILIGESDSKTIIYQELYCNGSYWDLCVVEGGGSLAFRDSEKYYFECQSKELKAAIIKHCI
ncbi:MAG: hypothetical protein ABIO44_10610, partial [Saprospiraceae bacterium]